MFGFLRSRSQLRNSYSTLFGIVQYYSLWQHRRSIQASLFTYLVSSAPIGSIKLLYCTSTIETQLYVVECPTVLY